MKALKKNPAILFFVYVLLILVLFTRAADRECEWTGIEKVIAIGDLHGDFDNFVKILKNVQLVDDELHWKGGNIHLVQTGDIMDKGSNAKKIFDLLMRLEDEAEQAGGMVHFLIGNHEEMNITGIAIDQPHYVNISQFLSFLPKKYREKRERKITKEFEKNQAHNDDSGYMLKATIRDFWDDAMRNDKEAKYKYTTNFNKEYGGWIIAHNAVIKINNTAFVHGGISKKYSRWKISDINRLIRAELEEFRAAIRDKYPLAFKPKIVYASDGPLWYRGLALKSQEKSIAEVEHILNNLKVKHMVIAHTPRTGSSVNLREQMNKYDERIWIIDTGISEIYGGLLSALIIESGHFTIWEPENE